MSNLSLERTTIHGACGHDCPDTCSWFVDVEGGQATRLYGNSAHPFTQGVLCAKVNHYLERVYDPQRMLTPLRRIGPKGAGQFARISWDEALREIAERWQAIIRESGAEAILPFSFAGNQGLIQMGSLDRRLFGVLGASRLDRDLCGSTAAAGMAATQGTAFGMDPEDLVHSRYIILWGTNTLVTNQHLWPVIRDARARGARIVVIDPIRTRTAAQADWHLAPKPATDAALALGMMRVIVDAGLVDRDYLDRYAEGYDELLQRLKDYPLDRVASLTGLPATDIERLAREYATTSPAAIRTLIGMEHHRNGAMIFRTLACLPILIGAWRQRGGGFCRSTGALQYSTMNIDGLVMPQLEQPLTRTLNMRDLGHLLAARYSASGPALAPPIRSLCIYNSNPAVTNPNQKLVRAGLARDDLFTVVHDLVLTDTAKYADIVLPATSQIEALDLMPAWGHLYLSLNRPAIAPCGEAVSNTELFRRLARALGRTESFLYDSDEQLIRTALNSAHPWLQGITFEHLWEVGSIRLNANQAWLPFAEGNFPTPTGKARLQASQLAELGHDPLPEVGPRSSGSPTELHLITGKALLGLNSSYAHLDRFQRRAGELAILVHPDDAAARHLEPDSLVTVSNSFGSVVARCEVSDDVNPGVVWMPASGLTDAAGTTHNVNQLTPEEPTDWGGGSGFYDAFVTLTRC